MVVNKAPQKAKKTKKHRKHGRNKLYCEFYARTNLREKNKLHRLKKHVLIHTTDQCAFDAIERCKLVV